MKLTIATDEKILLIEEAGRQQALPLYSKRAFELISQIWLKVGWDQKYPYTFSWLGRPIIQAPEDVLRIQEVIYQVKPEVIIETGVAHGGSLVFYASLMRAMGIDGRVIGVDVEIRPANRRAIEGHFLAGTINLIEGDSVASATVAKVQAAMQPKNKVLVILDSCHTKTHVLRELESYCPLVSLNSYIVATDGSMRELYDVPRGKPEWRWDNPAEAAQAFARNHPDFILEQPAWLFNESELTQSITHWPHAFLRRIK